MDGSGPNTGLGELHIPDLQPGSSIMPGKVNPVICEATIQVAAQVIGNDATIALSSTNGAFELNVGIPVMAANLLQSIRLLANVSRVAAEKMIDGLSANVERCRFLAEASPSTVTPLNKLSRVRGRRKDRQVLRSKQSHRARCRGGFRLR